MKKNFRNLLVALLALSMLACCFASCDKGTASAKVKVTIFIKNADGDPFLAGKDFEVDPTATVYDAVMALVAERGATAEVDTSGMFSKFVFDGSTLEGSQENLDNGNVKMTYFGWTLNGQDMNADGATPIKEAVVSEGASIDIFLKTEEITPDSN